MVGAVWRPQPHGGEFSTCMADLRRRAVAPIGPVRGPLCALRHRRARFDGRNGAGWPRFAIVAVLRALCAQILLFFVRPKYARAVLRADASVRCARCDEPHAVHRQEPPRAASSSTIPEPVRALARLAGPPANARRFCSVAPPIVWALSQARAMLQVRRAAPIWQWAWITMSWESLCVRAAAQAAPSLRVRLAGPATSRERGARREQDAPMQLQAGRGRVLVCSCRARTTRHQNLRIRKVNARPDALTRL